MAMLTEEQKAMGRFAVDVEVANAADVYKAEDGEIPPSQVRRVKIKGVVDSGAATLVLPQSVVDELGLPFKETKTVRYADHRTAQRPVVDRVYVEIQGRSGPFQASVEPDRTTALIGAIVLEEFDFLIDPKNQRLVPRDPKGRISEIEWPAEGRISRPFTFADRGKSVDALVWAIRMLVAMTSGTVVAEAAWDQMNDCLLLRGPAFVDVAWKDTFESSNTANFAELMRHR